MKKKCFGIKTKKTDKFDVKDVLARCFLCESITPNRVLNLLDVLQKETLPMYLFVSKTSKEIEELREKVDRGEEIAPMMREKWGEWHLQFDDLPTEEDFEYVEMAFGLTQGDLFGMNIVGQGVENENWQKELMKKEDGIKSAKELAAYVKQYIKGQDAAIELLSVPFYQHLDSKRKGYTCRIKSPAIVMGPTGVGKSEMLRVFGQACDCPVVRINSSEITPTAWRGLHVSDVLAKALNSQVSLKDLEYAVVVFHEFDKIVHYNRQVVSTNGSDADMDLMRDIMRLFETDHHLHLEGPLGSDMMSQGGVELPVDNLLIVFDGAFHGIENIVKKRLNIGTAVGYGQTKKDEYAGVNLQSLVVTEDLVKWGYMPELMGRIGEIVVMNPLSADMIYEIMVGAKDNVLQMHVDYCAHNNVELRFSEDALRQIALEAYKSGLGFRNVKTLLSKVLNRLYFDLPATTPSNKVVVEITKDYVLNHINGKQMVQGN